MTSMSRAQANINKKNETRAMKLDFWTLAFLTSPAKLSLDLFVLLHGAKPKDEHSEPESADHEVPGAIPIGPPGESRWQ